MFGNSSFDWMIYLFAISFFEQSFLCNKSNTTYGNNLVQEHNFIKNYKILYLENKGLKPNLLDSYVE